VLRDGELGGDDARELGRVQRWLQRSLTAPGATASVDDEAAHAIGCAAEPIALYRGMIALRFTREVAREFPATRALLGQVRFSVQARSFVRTHASTSYTLDGYACAFPQHLLCAGGAASRAAAELARLERELALVRAARTPSAGRSRAHGTLPRLEPAPGARVRCFTHDVDAALARYERGEAARAPRRRAVRLALFRRGASVLRLRITRREVPLLAALLRGEALEHAVALGLRAGCTAPFIGRVLEGWVRERLLIAG